jgi:predicted Zn-dependent peptidase
MKYSIRGLTTSAARYNSCMYRRAELSNGLVVATAEMPHAGSISFGIFIKVGSRHEDPSESGISHFVEHLLFQGTRTRTAQQIAQEAERMGDLFNAYTTEEFTYFEGRTLPKDLEAAVSLNFDMLLNSRFPSQAVEKERGVICEEIAMYEEQPAQKAIQMVQSMIWPKQSIGRDVTGSVAEVRRLTRDQLLEFHRKHYVARQMVVVFAGCITQERAEAVVRRNTGGLPTGGHIHDHAAGLRSIESRAENHA